MGYNGKITVMSRIYSFFLDVDDLGTWIDLMNLAMKCVLE